MCSIAACGPGYRSILHAIFWHRSTNGRHHRRCKTSQHDSRTFKIAAKCPHPSHHVARPYRSTSHAILRHCSTFRMHHRRCEALQRCIFQHVGNFAPDFGISQLFTIRFSNHFHHNAGNVMNFNLVGISNVYIIYF